MSSASRNCLSLQGRLAVNHQRPAETSFGQFSGPLRGADQDKLPNLRKSRVAAKCRLLQDQLDGILLGYKTYTTDSQKVTSRQTLNTVCPGWCPCCQWQNKFLDLVTATLKGLSLNNLEFLKRSQIRSTRWVTDPCKVKAMKDMLWREHTHLQMSGDVYRRCKQGKWVTRNGCHGSDDVNSLPELVIRLNQNNNGHANEELESEPNENKREGPRSRDKVLKGSHTTERNPKHSYKQRRRQRNTGITRVLKTNAVINHEHEKVSMIRHHVVEGFPGEPNKEKSSNDKYPTVTQTQSTAASVKEECTTSVLKKLLETLSNYSSSSDVPPILKDQLFTAVLQPFLHGGYNSRLSVMSNFLTNPAILPPAADSPDHLVAVHDQHIPEAQSKQSKHVMVTPSAVNRINESGFTEVSPSIDFSPSTEFSPSIDFSPSTEFSPSTVFSSSHPNTNVEDPETHNGTDLSYREPYANETIDDSLPFIDNPTDDEKVLVQDVRSPSFVPLGQHGKSGSVSPSCESLGQHGHCGFDIYFEIDECKPFSPVHTRVGARYHLNTFTYNITSPDETISEIQKPFSSEFVFKSVFGSSMTICSEFWNIHPPVLPSHLIRFKVLEDGISDKVIGRGCFGQVVEGTLRLSAGERDVVIKEHYLGKTRKEDIIQEARISLFLESTGAVPICYGLLQNTYEDISIILELFGSGYTLKSILLEGNLSRVGWLSIVCQLAAALGKIHENNVLINDIKPDNVLVDMSNTVARVKFCDMGSASYKSGVVFQDENMEVFSHLAPEVRAYSVTTKANDIYGLGKVIQQIYMVSQISNLLHVYLNCTVHCPTDRLTTDELRGILTTIYRKEIMSSEQHHPLTSVQYHPLTSGQHQPMSSEHHPMTSKHHPVSSEHHPMSSVQYHPLTFVQYHPLTSVQYHPLTSEQHHPMSSEHHPMSSEHHPMTSKQHHPMTSEQHHPMSSEHHPMSSEQHHPLSSVQQQPVTSEQHHPLSSVQQHPVTYIQNHYIVTGLDEENTFSSVRSSSKKLDTVSVTAFSEQGLQTSAVQDLPTSSIQNLPTSFIQDLSTSSVQDPPTSSVQDLPTSSVQDLPTSFVQDLSTSSLQDLPTLPEQGLPTSPLCHNTTGNSQTSANASVCMTSPGVKDTLKYPSQIERSSPNCSFLTAAEQSTTTLRPCTPCTSLYSNQRICDKKLRKHHRLYKSQPDYELTAILLLILVLLFLPGLIISGDIGFI